VAPVETATMALARSFSASFLVAYPV